SAAAPTRGRPLARSLLGPRDREVERRGHRDRHLRLEPDRPIADAAAQHQDDLHLERQPVELPRGLRAVPAVLPDAGERIEVLELEARRVLREDVHDAAVLRIEVDLALLAAHEILLAVPVRIAREEE